MSFVAAGVGVAGLGTAIYGSIKAGQDQKKLEKAQSPAYTPSQSIADYYQKALDRYSLDPYQSAAYQQQQQNIQNQTATGLGTLQGNRSAIGGVGALVAGGQTAQLANTAQAQQQQGAALGQLGQAAGAQTQQGEMAFDVNSMQPFTRNYNLLAMKASGANQLANAGISSVNNAANSIGSQMAMKKYGYGGGNSQKPLTGPVTSGSAASYYSQQPNPNVAMQQIYNPAIGATPGISNSLPY